MAAPGSNRELQQVRANTAHYKCEWKQGEPGGRTDEWPSQRRDEIAPPRANLPFPRHPLCSIGATRQGFPSARLLSPVAALGLDGVRLRCGADFRDEAMAGLVIPLEENQNAVFP